MVALFCGMFTQYIRQWGPLVAPLSITVGLPLEMMSGDEAVVAANIEAVRRWMKGTHQWTGGTTSGVRRLLEMVNVQRLSRGELDMRLRSGDLKVSFTGIAVKVGDEFSGWLSQ